MRLLIFVFCFIDLCSCGNPSGTSSRDSTGANDSLRQAAFWDSVQKDMDYNRDETSVIDSTERAALDAALLKYDTITSNDNFIKYFADSIEDVYITWGTKSNGIVDTVFDEDAGGYYGPCSTYYGETDKYLLVKSYGHGYMHVTMLPLNSNDTVCRYEGVIALDASRNLILTTTDDGALMLTNFSNEKHKVFMPESIPMGMYGIYEIDSISFRKDAVYLEWEGEQGKETLLQKL